MELQNLNAMPRDDVAAAPRVAPAAVDRSLQGFEEALLTPPIAGEIEPWASGVWNRWADFVTQVADAIEHDHLQQFVEIEREDAALAPRVDQLRETDRRLLASAERLTKAFRELSGVAQSDQHGREQFDRGHAVAELVKDGGSFLMDWKAQTAAIRAAFQETFNRERGVGD